MYGNKFFQFLLAIVLSCPEVSGDPVKPNLVVVLTDDQDRTSLFAMQKMDELIRTRGVRFVNAFSTTPVCCPARSSLLTGLYQHSHRVFNNSRNGNCYGSAWQSEHEPFSIGASLKSAGYKTFYAGKYLNEYKEERVPPGWDWWAGLHGNSVYYNYTININGTNRMFGDRPEDYLTDVLAGWTQDFLKASHQTPFFMMVATPAPHEPFTPSLKYKDYYKGLIAPRYPNFNAGRANKHWLVRSGRHLTPKLVALVDQTFQRRMETLLSVDDMVADIINQVPSNTYVIFTSDHGFHLGQYSMPWDKRQPYEADIRVPLAIWGPRIAAGAALPHPILNIDIAPTLYSLGGVVNPPKTDGVSFLPLLDGADTNFNRSFVIEYHGEGGEGPPCYTDNNVKLCHQELDCHCFDAKNNSFTCVRRLSTDTNSLYCKFHDDEQFIEKYDMQRDPYQLHNLAV